MQGLIESCQWAFYVNAINATNLHLQNQVPGPCMLSVSHCLKLEEPAFGSFFNDTDRSMCDGVAEAPAVGLQ